MYRLFTKPWSGVVLPIIRKVYPPLVVKDLVSVQPMTLPSGVVFHLKYVKFQNVFELYEELWWEDFKDGELWCPQTQDDFRLDEYTFKEMRRKELIFEDWEIEQFNTYVNGVGNDKKQLVGSGFKAMWFPEK